MPSRPLPPCPPPQATQEPGLTLGPRRWAWGSGDRVTLLCTAAVLTPWTLPVWTVCPGVRGRSVHMLGLTRGWEAARDGPAAERTKLVPNRRLSVPVLAVYF